MINSNHVPVLKVLIPYALGSVAGYKGSMDPEPPLMLMLAITFWLGSVLMYRLSRSCKRFFHCCFFLFIQLLFFILGTGLGAIDKPVDPGLPGGEYLVIRGSVRDEPVLQYGKLVFGMELCMARSDDSLYQVCGLVKTYLDTGQVYPLPEAGEVWDFQGRLIPIKNAGNPGEVDYASILHRKNYWYRFYCDSAMGMNRTEGKYSGRIPGPGEVRKALSAYWEGPPETISLLKAVCLGDRGSLSEDLRRSYSLAGGMHLLAVSGLHVGLIWWVLNRIFSFIVLLGKREIYRALLITLILWTYAYITGFSSSVSRSVTMFTFYAMSRIRMYRGHSVNAILVSMFMLTLIHPGRFLDLGFQLSYAAILSIVTLNPVFMGFWRPGPRLIRWCWEATGLSFAAQIGTLPLVIFYFHQVPVYALLTNLIAVPLLSILIAVFVVSTPMALSGFGYGIANSLLVMTGGSLNCLVEFIASFPGSVIPGLYIGSFTTIMLMILLFLLIVFLNNRKRLPLYLSVAAICVMGAGQSTGKIIRMQTAETRISHFSRGSLLSFREGVVVDHYILSDDPLTVARMDRYLSAAWGGSCFEVSVIRLREDGAVTLFRGGGSFAIGLRPGLWLLGNSRYRGILLERPPSMEILGILSELNPDFLLLSCEPELNVENVPPVSANLVLDGSNRSWYSGELEKAGLKFFDTATRGAFVLTD